MDLPTCSIASQYIMTMHSPLDAPQKVASDLEIYNARSGGWVKGPSIEGRIISPSGDWLRYLPNGTAKLDARFSILADDGSIIYASYSGRVSGYEKALERRRPGEALRADDAYVIICPTFETLSSKYGWLNEIVCIGKLTSARDDEDNHVTYEVFAIS